MAFVFQKMEDVISITSSGSSVMVLSSAGVGISKMAMKKFIHGSKALTSIKNDGRPSVLYF